MTDTSINPLIAEEMGSIFSGTADLYWDRWQEEWNRSNCVQVRLGLLHVIPRDKDSDRYWRESVLFLLKIADGHKHMFTLCRETGGTEGKTEVSKKAFSMLCTGVFPGSYKHGGYIPRCWYYLFEEKEVLDALIHFFRAKTPSSHDLPQSSYPYNFQVGAGMELEHREAVAMLFVYHLSHYVWNWEGNSRWSREKEENWNKYLESLRPKVIEILHAFGLLFKFFAWGSNLGDESALTHLEELALRAEVPNRYSPASSDRRKVASLDEAVYAGSAAAMIHGIITVRNREAERHRAIHEAEKAKQEAEMKILELRRKK